MKKQFIPTRQVLEFIEKLPDEVQGTFHKYVEFLEKDGRLVPPYGEKVEKNLFAIRIIGKYNVRVFYCYIDGDEIIGFNAIMKKTNKLSLKDKKQAVKLMKQIRNG